MATSTRSKKPSALPPAGRAPYASDPALSRGRVFAEPESKTRSAFQRDRDRIIHSSAFRRLKQKTQVFVAHEGDHYRTRLTHSLEVAQIARSIAKTLRLDEELAEALALAHDLGHPPFGHAGETALDECMQGFGGFDHNANTIRLVTKIEARYAEFDGLNLTWETLEGVVKHNGPILKPGVNEAGLPWALRAYPAWRGLELETYASLEAQVAALADDIAYNNHDVDDGLRAGLFGVEDLLGLPMVGDAFREVTSRWPGLEQTRLIHESVRRMIGFMVEDCVAETRRRLAEADPQSVDDVRGAGRALVAFSAEMVGVDKALRAFLWPNMYRHWRVNRMMNRAKRVVRELFGVFLDDPGVLPPEWAKRAGKAGEADTARAACDYIAGMTDRFALDEHRRLFGTEPYA